MGIVVFTDVPSIGEEGRGHNLSDRLVDEFGTVMQPEEEFIFDDNVQVAKAFRLAIARKARLTQTYTSRFSEELAILIELRNPRGLLASSLAFALAVVAILRL